MATESRPLQKADLLDAAWERFEAARNCILAREALAAAAKPMTQAREKYMAARERAEAANKNFEATEQRLLLQEGYPLKAVRQ